MAYRANADNMHALGDSRPTMCGMNAAAEILHPIAISQVMLNFAAGYGVSADVCLLGTGIDAADLLEPDALITRDQELRLVENLMLALPDEPALGFKLGLHYNVATFGIWGFALRTSRTLFEALRHALRYLPLSTAYCQITMCEDGDMLAVRMDPSPIPRHLRQFLLERDMATAVNLVHELSLSGVHVRSVHFRAPDLEYGDVIASLCGVPPRIACEHNELLIPRADADRPLSTYDPHLVRMLEDQCRQQLERRQQSGIAGQVRTHLLGELGLVAGIEDVAKAMAVSPRSLRRKLDAEGTTFRHILETERRQLAEHLLATTRITLDELAIQLGYSDTASFTRAFRRWNGVSPGEFRKQAHLPSS